MPIHSASDEATPPAVTAFIAAYNRERYAVEAVESILQQTFGDLECLVIDDGSSDGTAQSVSAIDDPRVRLVRNEQNLGIPKTRNRGIDLARGRYIAILDSDDVARPERIQRQVDFLDAHPEIAAVGSWAHAIDPEGGELGKVHRCPTSPRALSLQLLFRVVPRQSTMMIRRSVLEKYRYREEFSVMQDMELFGRLAHCETITALPEVLTLFRHHPGRITLHDSPERYRLRRINAHDRLAELGIDASPTEIEKHLLLGSDKKVAGGLRLDAEMIRWSQAWLLRLIGVEERLGGGKDEQLLEAASLIWRRLLKRAAAELGAGVLLAQLGSPLSRPIRAELLGLGLQAGLRGLRRR